MRFSRVEVDDCEIRICGRKDVLEQLVTGGAMPAGIARRAVRSFVPNWLGRQDSNLGMAESKSAALPLGDAPIRRSDTIYWRRLQDPSGGGMQMPHGLARQLKAAPGGLRSAAAHGTDRAMAP